MFLLTGRILPGEGILHRDLNPKNIFLSFHKTAIKNRIHVLLSNFAFSRIKELEKALISEDEKRCKLNDVTEVLDTLRQNISDATFETKRKVCELLIQEIRVGKNKDGVITLNIAYYCNKDWIKDDTNFELLTARTGIHLCVLGY